MPSPGNNLREDWIDYLRVIAAIGVVGTHVTAHYYQLYGKIGMPCWWLADVLNAFSSIFPVPLFVMISGALLLGREISVKGFYKARLRRLAPAVIFWNFLYLLFLVATGQTDLRGLLWFLKGGWFIRGESYFHLWYLSMFLCLMSVAPFLNLFVRGIKASDNELRLLIGVLLIFFCAHESTLIAQALRGPEYISSWYTTFPWYIIYFVGGYYMNRAAGVLRVPRAILLVLIGVIPLIAALLNSIVAIRLKRFDYFLLDNASPLVFIFTFSLFLLFRKMKGKLRVSGLLAAMSESSFGVYLLHPLYLYLYKRIFPAYDRNGMIYMPLGIVFIAAASFVTAHYLRRIPFFRRVT